MPRTGCYKSGLGVSGTCLGLAATSWLGQADGTHPCCLTCGTSARCTWAQGGRCIQQCARRCCKAGSGASSALQAAARVRRLTQPHQSVFVLLPTSHPAAGADGDGAARGRLRPSHQVDPLPRRAGGLQARLAAHPGPAHSAHKGGQRGSSRWAEGKGRCGLVPTLALAYVL